MKYILLFIISISAFSIEIQKPKVYQGDENITSWVMSEKLDGIRAYWNGVELQTRKGKKIYAPESLLKNFPSFELDGELWTKREDFENIQNIVMDKTPSKDWKNITYNIFEVPNAKGDFFQRLEKAKLWFENHSNKRLKIIKQIKIRNKKHLNSYLEEIISKHGEGVIIKNPRKNYFLGRSAHILKVKKSQDMEGEVIGINMSLKTGVLKSLKVKLENGVIFNLGIGFSKKERENPVQIGEIITFKYFGFTKRGKPKFASFLHTRED